MSFPSGHACAAFAGFGFLALWLNGKCKIFGPQPQRGQQIEDRNRGEEREGDREGEREGRKAHWKLVLFVAPLLLAVLLAASKVRDGWHHVSDVVAGALVGSAFAVMAYRMVYRSVWDARDNHVAREREE